MKKFSLVAFLCLLLSCAGQKFPEKMPDDFKIEYHLDGGKVNVNRTIVLQKGECYDKGRNDKGEDFEYEVDIDKPEDLEKLYIDLKRLNAFALKSNNQGEVMDRGGESIKYTVNGKTYEVSNSQNMFIDKKDLEAFNASLNAILSFADMHRE